MNLTLTVDTVLSVELSALQLPMPPGNAKKLEAEEIRAVPSKGEAMLKSKLNKSVISMLTVASAASVMVYGTPQHAAADPVSPTGWTTNLPIGVPLPGGLYFADTAYYMDRSGPTLAPGVSRVDAEVNLPTFLWSTPANFLGGHVEAIVVTPELAAQVGLDDGSSIGKDAIYNPVALIGEAWNLGSGFSASEFVGTFFPVDTFFGTVGLGGNFWTFTSLTALAYNSSDGWSLNANLTYLHSGNDISSGIHTQADTLNVDFAAVKHIDNWELGFIGNASTDVGNSFGNNWGAHPYSQVALGGLVGHTFGSVTAELFATRSVEARNQAPFGGYDTRVWGRIIIPLWNPPAPAAPVVAKY